MDGAGVFKLEDTGGQSTNSLSHKIRIAAPGASDATVKNAESVSALKTTPQLRKGRTIDLCARDEQTSGATTLVPLYRPAGGPAGPGLRHDLLLDLELRLERKMDVKVQELQDEIAELRQRIAKGSGQPGSTVSVDNAQDLQYGKEVSKHLEDEAEDYEEEYQINMSIWDASLAVGFAETRIDVILTLTALFANAFIQVLFCIIVYTNIASQNPLTDNDLKGFLEWRVAVGHDAKHYDRGTHTSLVTRICSGASTTIMGTGHMDKYKELGSYAARDSFSVNLENAFPLMTSGPSLCSLSLAIWLLALFSEIITVTEWIRACLSLPRRRKTDFKEVGEGLKVVSVTSVRFALMLIVGIVRLGIAAFLCYTGALFLVHTFSLADLMMNAIMLAFILDMDEFIYDKLAPAKCREHLEKIQPIPISRRLMLPGRRLMDPRKFVIIILLITAMAILVPLKVAVETDYVVDAQGILCDGNQNFIFATDRATGIVTVAETEQRAETNDNEYAFQAVLQRTALVENDVDTIPLLGKFERPQSTIYALSSRNKVLDMLSESVMESVDALTCENTLHGNASAIRVVQDLFSFHSTNSHWTTSTSGRPSNQNITGCHQVLQMCDSSLTIRSLCPVACGCDDAIRVIFDRQGCPVACERRARTRRASRIGHMNNNHLDEDIMNETYIGDWVRYFDSLQTYLLGMDFFNASSSASRRLQGTSTTVTNTNIMTWGREAEQRLAVDSWFEFAFNVSSNGVNLSHLALQAFEYASYNYEPTCQFAELMPKLFNFDPCREDNAYSSSSRPFGSLRGLCPKTCCLLTSCTQDNDTSTTEGRVAVRSWHELFALQQNWGLNFLLPVFASGDDCVVYSSYMCEYNMFWCSNYSACPGALSSSPGQELRRLKHVGPRGRV